MLYEDLLIYITANLVRLSQSGLALNIVIDQHVHTVPMRSHMRVIKGRERNKRLRTATVRGQLTITTHEKPLLP
ncbi:MAG: hypothetical protein WC295_13590 [Methanoregula sp.]